MKNLHNVINASRIPLYGELGDHEVGAFRMFTPAGVELHVIAANGMGWDHVSVSAFGRTPTWDEMEFVRHEFFLPTETVMQLHVPASDHINHHPHCLHLWRPHADVGQIPRPPGILVGPSA